MSKNTRYILKEALKGCVRKNIAKAMEMQLGSLNNQIAGELPYFPKGSTLNFLDRTMNCIEEVEAQTGKLKLLEWMAEEFGCILIKNPAIQAANTPPIAKISEIIGDFAHMVDEIAKANEDLSIEPNEGEKIRAKWEIMKRVTEEFLLAAETGIYAKPKK